MLPQDEQAVESMEAIILQKERQKKKKKRSQ